MPEKFREGEKLDSDLYSIGINVSCGRPSQDPNIEDTLMAAAIDAVLKKNGRTAGLLVDWISKHYVWINVDRLTTLVESLDERDFHFVKVFWCANAERLLKNDLRFKRLSQIYKGKRVDYLDRFLEKDDYRSTPFLIKKNREDERFLGTCMRVPKKVFSHRPGQIHEASVLSKHHMSLRYRIMMGPSYRADMWAVLRRSPEATAYEIAKKTYGSYASAHRAKRDYMLLKRDYSERGRGA